MSRAGRAVRRLAWTVAGTIATAVYLLVVLYCAVCLLGAGCP